MGNKKVSTGKKTGIEVTKKPLAAIKAVFADKKKVCIIAGAAVVVFLAILALALPTGGSITYTDYELAINDSARDLEFIITIPNKKIEEISNLKIIFDQIRQTAEYKQSINTTKSIFIKIYNKEYYIGCFVDHQPDPQGVFVAVDKFSYGIVFKNTGTIKNPEMQEEDTSKTGELRQFLKEYNEEIE